jgi:serine/threonine-protein kinase
MIWNTTGFDTINCFTVECRLWMSILQDDQVINNTYTVERFLGEGAFAEVYRVRHRFLGRQAMKVFKLAGLTMNEVEEQLSEAVILSQINHPNIIRVFDANIFEDEGRMYGFFVMEYISGGRDRKSVV